MLKKKKNSYFIFGNPVNHSKSPLIHSLFSKQIRLTYSYYSLCVSIKKFSSILLDFFDNDIQGAN
ncbi:shikimate dehydrogenase, partial [Buchnera aphidicola]|nr:shikimate dehydrogenase [Buchnera aphidicola]